MPVVNRIAAFAPEMAEWRQHLHRNPELGLDCHATADFVAARLEEFGIEEIHRGLGKTGVVAVIHGQGGPGGPVIGLRADMDALPIHEETGAPHASQTPGKMHACGHDGHTAMLLGTAKYLAETRNFKGTAVLIFQPGEEGAGGAQAMVDDGVMERFGISEVYAIHTSPEAPLGVIATRPGPLLAAVDIFEIRIKGRSGHGAHPETTADPVAAAFQLGAALQTVVSRNVPAVHQAVVSITRIESGSAFNIIPETAVMGGTVRTHQPETRDLVQRRMGEVCVGVGAAMDCEITLDYRRMGEATLNDPDKVTTALGAAREVAAAARDDIDPLMAGEDFALMLKARPGAMLLLGQGLGPSLHNDHFDFNDEAAPIGASFFARLVERTLPV